MPTPVRGAGRATGRPQTASTITVRIDDTRARSDFTIHIEHPSYDQGVRCFYRGTRDRTINAITRHITDHAPDAHVELINDTDLEITTQHLTTSQRQAAPTEAPA